MTKIVVRTEGHYEVHETPFSRAYDWYPACVILECECGEKLALTGSSSEPACLCGVNHSSVIQDIQEREGRLQHETTHPWHFDLQGRRPRHSTFGPPPRTDPGSALGPLSGVCGYRTEAMRISETTSLLGSSVN